MLQQITKSKLSLKYLEFIATKVFVKASTSVLLNFLSILHALLFLFYTITFTKYPHQFIYFTRYFNKIFILLNFFIISLNYPLPTYALSLSLFYLLSFFLKNYQPRSLLHRVLSSPADPDPFFIGRSTNQAPATHILSSLAGN